MLGEVFDLLFGCGHNKYSFPITTRKGSTPRNEAARVTGTYVVCLDCGKEFAYDWQEMKLVDAQGSRTKGMAASTAESLGKSA